MHDAPRRQTPPHPEVRPGILAEPGPQRSDRSLRRSSGDGSPTLGLPVLAGASGESVDSSALSLLTAHTLEAKRKEEEEVQQEKEEKHVPDSTGWMELCDHVKGKTNYWNRRTRQSVWTGIRVVWVGRRNSEDEVYYWHKDSRVRSFDLHPLPPGYGGRGEGLASPYSISGATRPEIRTFF